MLSKKPQPVIGKFAGTCCFGKQTSFSDACTSPTSPLDYTNQSPRGLKSYDLGSVGLAIVADLEKSDAPSPRNQIQANKALFVQNITRSNPIPVKPTKATKGCDRYSREDSEESDTDSSEDYTFVTYRGPNKSYTRVYHDKGSDNGRIGHEKDGFDRRSKNNGLPVFEISQARSGGDHFTAYPASDFLSSCNLCQKNLHGRDIFMYRGDKAFCSTECRYRQIVMDERKEQCSSEASRSSADVSSSPYNNGQIFSSEILAI